MTVGALRSLGAALLGAVAGLSAPTAHAAMLAPCAEPVLFPGADVNLVVIPYALGGPDENYKLRPDIDALARSEAAGKLANLIQLDTLYSLRYPVGMAVVHLIPSGEPCGPDDVLPNLEAQLGDGKGLILLWGNFLEEEGHVYVQSYLELFRKERSELVDLRVDLLGGEVELTGGPSQRALGFAPRILTEDDLARIGDAGDRARLIWSDPAGGHVVDELPASVEEPYAYYVTEIAPEFGTYADQAARTDRRRRWLGRGHPGLAAARDAARTALRRWRDGLSRRPRHRRGAARHPLERRWRPRALDAPARGGARAESGSVRALSRAGRRRRSGPAHLGRAVAALRGNAGPPGHRRGRGELRCPS